MSYTITNNIMYVRNDTGELVPVSMIASGAVQTIQAIKDTAAAAELQIDTKVADANAAIEAKTDEQVARIPEVTTLAEDVSGLKDDLSKEITNRNSAIYKAVNEEKERAVAKENEIEALFTMPTQEAINSWLNEHPEATTTVQDHSLTIDKMVIGTLGYVTPQMFGAKNDGSTISNEYFQKAVDSGFEIYVPEGTYLFNIPSGNEATGGFRITRDNTKLIIDKNAILKFEDVDYNGASHQGGLIVIDSANNVTITGGIINGDELSITDNEDHNGAIFIYGSSNVTIEDMTIKNISKDGIFILNKLSSIPNNIVIKNCVMDTIHRNGIVVSAVTNLLVENVEITNVRDTSYSYAVDLEKHSEYEITDVVFRNCNFHDNSHGGIISSSNINRRFEVDGGHYQYISSYNDNAIIKNAEIEQLYIYNCRIIEGCIVSILDIYDKLLDLSDYVDTYIQNSIIYTISSNKQLDSEQRPTSVYIDGCVIGAYDKNNELFTASNNIINKLFLTNSVMYIKYTMNNLIANELYVSNCEVIYNDKITDAPILPFRFLGKEKCNIFNCTFFAEKIESVEQEIGLICLGGQDIKFCNNKVLTKSRIGNNLFSIDGLRSNGGEIKIINNYCPQYMKQYLFSSYTGGYALDLGHTRKLKNNIFAEDEYEDVSITV